MSRRFILFAVWFVALAGAPLWAIGAAPLTFSQPAAAAAPGWASLPQGVRLDEHTPRDTEQRDRGPARRWADVTVWEVLDGNELPEPGLPGFVLPRLTALGPALPAPRPAALSHGCLPLRQAPKTGPPVLRRI